MKCSVIGCVEQLKTAKDILLYILWNSRRCNLVTVNCYHQSCYISEGITPQYTFQKGSFSSVQFSKFNNDPFSFSNLFLTDFSVLKIVEMQMNAECFVFIICCMARWRFEYRPALFFFFFHGKSVCVRLGGLPASDLLSVWTCRGCRYAWMSFLFMGDSE